MMKLNDPLNEGSSTKGIRKEVTLTPRWLKCGQL